MVEWRLVRMPGEGRLEEHWHWQVIMIGIKYGKDIVEGQAWRQSWQKPYVASVAAIRRNVAT
jgi:hypothetical protein